MEKVSIIIPVYNAEKYLERLVNSLNNQTYSNLEIIFVNDGSKDNSKEILNKIKKDNYIVIDQENGGVTKARNKGLEIASGHYITFVDSDDFIDEDYILNLVAGLEKNNADLCVMGYKKINNDSVTNIVKLEEETLTINTLREKIAFLNNKNGSAIGGKLYKKEYMFPFQHISIGEDLLFNLSYIEKHNRIALISNVDYNYVYNNQSLTNTLKVDLLKELEETLNTLPKNDIFIFYTYRIYQEFILNIYKNNKKLLKEKIYEIKTLPNVSNNLKSNITFIVANFSFCKRIYFKIINKCFKKHHFALLYLIEKMKLELKYGKKDK